MESWKKIIRIIIVNITFILHLETNKFNFLKRIDIIYLFQNLFAALYFSMYIWLSIKSNQEKANWELKASGDPCK